MIVRILFFILIFQLALIASSDAQGFRDILSRKSPSSFVFNFENDTDEAVPVFVDIDGDKDLDVFVGQENGFISFFENTGDEFNPSYAEPVTNPFGIEDNFEFSAPAFVDLDNDGDYDLYVGTANGGSSPISSYYENTGNSTSPIFEKLAGLSPFNLMPVGANLKFKPAFGDLDGDGDKDVVFGATNGFWYQENIGTSASPNFGDLVSDTFELPSYSVIEELTPHLLDFDNDGDLDLITGRKAGNVFVYLNNGDKENPDFVTNPRLLMREYKGRSAPAFGDIDNDGDLDMMVAYPTSTHMDWYMGVAGQSHFVPDTLSVIVDAVDVGFSAHPEFIDIDFDGDLDIIIGSDGGDLFFHLNVGTLQNPDYLIHTVNPYGLMNMGERSSPAAVRFDNSGKQTIFVGVGSGDFWEFENIGSVFSPIYILKGLNTRGLSNIGDNASPAFISLDGTNDPDLISGELNGGFKHFLNQGIGVDPQFIPVPDNPFGLVDIGFLSTPTFADFDGDLDEDMFVGDIGGNIHYFRNSNLFAPMYGLKMTNFFDLYGIALASSPSAGDIDNDGDIDLLVGYTDGKSVLFENRPCKSSYSLNHINTGQQLYQSEGTITTKSYVAAVDDVTLLGSLGVEMGPGFEVSTGAELITEIGACKNN